MTLDARPVCMFCQTRFSLALGETSACESWRAINREHVERRVATPEQHARLKLEAELSKLADNICAKAKPDADFGFETLMDPDDDVIRSGTKKIPAPTPFDAAALRVGKPTTPQPGLF